MLKYVKLQLMKEFYGLLQGHAKKFFFCKGPDSKYFRSLWATRSPLQLLKSAIIMPKQP